MEITPPFGYHTIIPLSREMRIRRPTGTLPAFATHRSSLPIAVTEVVAAGHDYPVAFLANGASTYIPVVLLGVAPDENLFAKPEGWEPGLYIPACVRRYPYCMARTGANGSGQPQSIICVEQEFIDDQGDALFDQTGAPTPAFAQVQYFLGQFEADLERTHEICQIIADYKLFEPMTAQIRIGETTFDLGGLHRIALQKMEHLTSNQLKTLVKRGGMALIYQHQASMFRFERMTQRKMYAMTGSTGPDAPPSLPTLPPAESLPADEPAASA